MILTSPTLSPARPSPARFGTALKVALVLATGALAGCQSGSDSGGSTLKNFLLYAGPTVPTPAPPEASDIDCPVVTIPEGGEAIRVGAGQSVREQVAITTVARECVPNGPSGAYVLKVGVEGLAVLGAGGGAGRMSAPVHIVVRDGDRVLANRVRQVPIAIPAGQTQGAFSIVEDGIAVPANASPTIEASIGGSASVPTERRRRR